MTETPRERILLLDLLKVFTLFAIQVFHAWEFIFFEDQQIHTATSWFFWALSWPARAFTLGGQILVVIVFLLFGFTGKGRKYFAKIIPFALVGQVLVTFAFMDNGNFFQNLEWDIYTFIAFSVLILFISPTSSWLKLAASSALFLIPPSIWKSFAPEGAVFDVLTGRESEWSNGAWAVLPWFFLAYAFYNLGGLLREKKLSLNHWFRFEGWIWACLLAASLPVLGFYYFAPVGPNYYLYLFHQNTLMFLANFLPFLLVIRISFLKRVREWSEKQALLRWISQTMWARYVGLCYMVAVAYLAVGAHFDDIFRTVPFAFDVYFLLLMPVTEIIVKKIVALRFRTS